MQKWIFEYTCGGNQEHTTFFMASDREVAEIMVDIFFRMMMGIGYPPEVLRTAWVSSDKFDLPSEILKKSNKVFEGSVINEEGEKKLIFLGFLYNTADLKKATESQATATETFLDRLKKNTGLPPI